MKKFELNVVNFDNEDVIATSVLVTVDTESQNVYTNQYPGYTDPQTTHNHLVSVMGEDDVDYTDEFVAAMGLENCAAGWEWLGGFNPRTSHTQRTSAGEIVDGAQYMLHDDGTFTIVE